MAYGVAQSQLEVLELEDETCVNEAYLDHGFDIPVSELSEGVQHYEQYVNNVYDIFGYDRLTKLDLSVWPIYYMEESKAMIPPFPVIDGSKLKSGVDYQIVEGDNLIDFITVHGCDSVVLLHVIVCPATVKDADSNEYATVVLDQYCWTKSNLKTTHYFGDAHENVAKALIYSPGESVNEGIYGRLYTWYSAVNVPEYSTDTPPVDADGFIRGICPAGWHIPASPEIASLESHSPNELRSPDLWLTGGGTNSTGFTLLPAGLFNASTGRFENLRGEAWMWKTSSTSTTAYDVEAVVISYDCDIVVTVVTNNASNAYSVRCVKNY